MYNNFNVKEFEDDYEEFYHDLKQNSPNFHGDKSGDDEDLNFVAKQGNDSSTGEDVAANKYVIFRKKKLKTKDTAIETDEVFHQNVDVCASCQRSIDDKKDPLKPDSTSPNSISIELSNASYYSPKSLVILKFISKLGFFSILLICLSMGYKYSLHTVKWKKEILIPNLLSCGLVILGCLKLLLINFYHRIGFGCAFSVHDYTVSIIFSSFLSIEWMIFCLDFVSTVVNILIIALTTLIVIFMKFTNEEKFRYRYLQKLAYSMQTLACFFTPIIPHQISSFNLSFVFIFLTFWLSIFMAIYITSMFRSFFENGDQSQLYMANYDLYQSTNVFQCIYIVFSIIHIIDLTEIKNIIYADFE